jgi:hypothetical protein
MTMTKTEKNLQNAFNKFSCLLNERFEKKVFTKEDPIRYTFFYVITKELELSPHEILLESPHPQIDKAEIDMQIPETSQTPELIFEFKYDVKRQSVIPHPYKAGSLFMDIFRLSLYKKDNQNSRCFLVYVTDSQMANYLSRDRNHLNDFFNLQPNQELMVNEEYVKNHSETFVKQASKHGIHNCIVKSCLDDDLAESHFVRIYEIFC